MGVTTDSAKNIEQTGASLSASYFGASSEPAEVGFLYGTSSSSMTQKISGNGYSGTASSFRADLNGLAPGVTYYAQAYVVIDGKTTFGNTISFTTITVAVQPAVNQPWLELPAAVSGSQYVVTTLSSDGERNYTHFYDKTNYLSLWTAYPLKSAHMGSLSRPDNWAYNPNIETKYQANLKSKSYGTGEDGKAYSRGHMIPNASRNGIKGMQDQTFYVTNSVPQRQDDFNGSIWADLEEEVQKIAKSEEIYVVTGVALNKVGENKKVYYVSPKDDTSKRCAIPNYFYKVILKVNYSGSTVTSASTIGFWFVHQDYEDRDYIKYSVSVDQIESWTGFDFFVNLPDNVENAAEANESWSTFINF